MTADPIPSIRALPERALADLASALRSGRVSERATAFDLRYIVPAVSEAAAEEVTSLLGTGLTLQHGALLLEAIASERGSPADNGAIELVTSGPDIVGATRDTGVVMRELFGTAESRVLVVGFAVHQGREIFAALAERMQHRPDLSVRLCLDVRRAPGDTTKSDALLLRFVTRFTRDEWPGSRLPDLFYDPRGLAETVDRASLHAKCVVVDGARALVGSANLTEAAQLRNIEIGLLVTSSRIATALESHIQSLIAANHLHRIPLGR
jgi:hypothetical protein